MERKRKPIPSANQRGKRGKEKAETQESETSFSDLPLSITTHILVRLPIKFILICKRVCRTWYILISDPHFAKLHFNRSPLTFMIRTSHPERVSRTLHFLEYEYHQPEIVDSELIDKVNYVVLEPKFKLPLMDASLVWGERDNCYRTGYLRTPQPKDYRFNVANSCNGLLCLCEPRDGIPVVVCNPITGEFIRLPKVTRAEKFQRPVCSGVGFQPKTNEYKVIRMWYDFARDRTGLVTFEGLAIEVHTLGTPMWRNVEVDRDFFDMGRFQYPTCVNGALHWIVLDRWTWSIVCFNFESERLQFFPSPPFRHSGIPCREGVSMGTLGDSLFICNASFSNTAADMWVMKKYGIEKSWTKVYTFDTFGKPHCDIRLYWPLKHFEKGAAILEYNSYEGFTYSEPQKFRFKRFTVCGSPINNFEVIPHIPSLISLKDLVKGDNIEVLNVHSQCANLKLPEEYEDLYLAFTFENMKFYTWL